jgi:hypothetical protein
MVERYKSLFPVSPLLVHATLVALLLFLNVAISGRGEFLMAGGALTFAGYVYLSYVESKTSRLLLTPLSFYLLWYSVDLGLAAIRAGYRLAQDGRIDFSASPVMAGDVVAGYLVFVAGSLALHCGLQLFRPRRRDSAKPPDWAGGNSQEAALVLWGGGLAYLLVKEKLTALGTLGSFFQWAAIAGLAALFLARAIPASRILIVTVVSALTAACYTSMGSKAAIMFAFLPLVWVLSIDRRLRRWLPFVAAGLASLYLFLVAPIVMQSRKLPEHLKGSTTSALINGAKFYFEGDPFSDLAEAAGENALGFLDRQFDPIAAGFLHRDIAMHGLRWGETMDYWKYAFIPRILWPDKPTITQGAGFAVYAGFVDNLQKESLSLGITATGELYWNFGLLGVIAGMLLIGSLQSGLLWRLAGTRPDRDILAMWLYVSLVLAMPDMAEAVTTIVSILAMYLLFQGLFHARRSIVGQPFRSLAAGRMTPAMVRR